MQHQRMIARQGDITRQEVDALVNAANTSLMGGGGVDGAIHRAGGPAILEDCRRIIARQGSCKTGEAVVTTAGKLPAKLVIHTVGPVWQGGGKQEARLLENCYRHSLELAVANGCQTVAFPNISTGIYGYPKPAAAVIAVATTQAFLQQNPSIDQVIFVCFDAENLRLIQQELNSRQSHSAQGSSLK
jgi:O-acetyl-ADP-ribose deacetylase (regulator of RNase III)